MSNAFLYRMPSGIAGDVSRKSHSTIEAHVVGAQFAGFGLFGKLHATTGKFVPLTNADTVVYGLLVRAYPTQTAQNELGKAVPNATGMTDVLRRGYMTVKNHAGLVVKGAAVFVRINNATADKPLGGVEAIADGANTIAVNAIFMHEADAQGNVEISFNI